MTFELERASFGWCRFEREEKTANEILEKLKLPRGYDVRIDMNHTVFDDIHKEEYVVPKAYIKLDTLEDLMKFMHEIKEDVVICYKEKKIIIYDDWLE